ncbi:hypothetical protein [Maribacter sp. 2308TA10-17]|uniref:hypothetical protein n=1 Tax=Maribacter sp. 2308TA10-17 TaxID=3386276 RepID=UPI0039BC3F06
MRIKKYVAVLILSIFTSCGLSDVVDSINCLAEYNDPELLNAYSDALVALSNDPENQLLCQEFNVAADNYIAERIAYAKCLRDSGFTSSEDLEEIEQEIETLEAEREASRC